MNEVHVLANTAILRAEIMREVEGRPEKLVIEAAINLVEGFLVNVARIASAMGEPK